jgi:hypothetical protein
MFKAHYHKGRKSLSGPRPSGAKVTQDPRNVTDKAVMRQYINNIVEYLAERQYPFFVKEEINKFTSPQHNTALL